jgi:hypothetical protein
MFTFEKLARLEIEELDALQEPPDTSKWQGATWRAMRADSETWVECLHPNKGHWSHEDRRASRR